MSVPDLNLTKEAYLYMLDLVSKGITDDNSRKEYWSIREKQARLQVLISAIDEQIS